MSNFFRRLDEAEQEGRLKRLFANRPANLHDYQGCVNDPSMVHLPTPVEPKAQVESASVGDISDHEKGQKEEFYKFQQHLEKTQEEISKWPSWMREAGRASMGLDQREPKEVESGGLPPVPDSTWDEQTPEWRARVLAYESCFDDHELAVLAVVREDHLKASLLREQKLKELLGEAANAIARHWDITDQAAKDVALKSRAAAVKGE